MRRKSSAPARHAAPKFRRPLLGLEALEDRAVPATLSLTLADAALVENGAATTGTLTRTGDLSQALSVAIANSDATEAAAPASVTIPAGSATADFTVSPVDDAILDGTQSVTLTATATTGPQTVRPDPTFAGDGIVDTPALTNTTHYAYHTGAVLALPDGRTAVAASASGMNGWALQLMNPDGTVQVTSYIQFPGASGPGVAHAIARQADGKILVAGEVPFGGVGDFAVARYDANGSIDNSFGNNGTLTFGGIGYDAAYGLAVEADGNILVSGFDHHNTGFYVRRLSASGGLLGEAAVSVYAGSETVYPSANAMAVAPDGTIVLAGSVRYSNASAVLRLNADLSPDTSFGPGGYRTLGPADFGTYTEIELTGVAVLPGGKVVVGGTAWRNAHQIGGEFAAARFNADGTLDSSFAGDGTRILSLSIAGDQNNAVVYDLAVQPDGKLVLAGSASRIGNGDNQALARLNTDGTPDLSFNGTGYFVAADYPAQGSFEQINAIDLQADGRLVAQAGGTTPVTTGNTTTMVNRQWVARFDMATGEALTAAASLTVADDEVAPPELTLSVSPASFGEAAGAGAATATVTRLNAPLTADLVVTLSSSDATEATVPATVTIPAGQASVTFAVAAVDDSLSDGTQAVTLTATAAGGLTATAGVSVTDNEPVGPALVVTINRTGVLEQTGASAATGTVTRYNLPLDAALVVTLSSSDTSEATVPSSVTIPAGQASATFPIATADDTFTDGTQAVTITASATAPGFSGPITYDTTWGNSGWTSGFVRGRVAVAPDGKMVVAGTTGTVGSNADFGIRRFNANGTADTTFGSSGYVVLNPVGPSDQPEAVLVQPDGKIIVAGYGSSSTTASGEMVIVRLRTNGTLDGTEFGLGGVVRLTFGSGVFTNVLDAALQPDGKIVLAGNIGADFAVVRLNANGSLDTGFGAGGVVRTTLSAGAKAYGVAVAPDGTIVAVGSDGEGTGANQRLVVARYTSAGVLDGGFGTGGVVATTVGATATTYDERATDVAVQADGKVVVAALLRNTANGSHDYAALRFNADGTPDTGFAAGGRFIESTSSSVGGPGRVILQPDGRILLAGTTGSSTTARFVRLSAAGVFEHRANGTWSTSSTEGIAQDAAGNIYLAYNYSGGTSGYVDRYRSLGATVTGSAGLSVLDNEPFAALADSYTTTEETVLTVSAADGVRSNDTVTTPLSPTSVTAEVVSQPTRGTLSFNADGSFTYTPAVNAAGPDTFTYRLRDGAGVSNTATVTINVTNVNDAPVGVNNSYTTDEDTPLTVAAAAATTSLNMVSDPGDYIGQGQTYNYPASSGTFSISGSATYFTLSYIQPGYTHWWYLSFRSPFDNIPLSAGTYLNAERAAFRTVGKPGLDVSGDGRGSNTLTGQFTILQIETGANGVITRFAADFEQHSEGRTPALRGSIRFNYAPSGVGVLTNDTDPDNDPLTAVVVAGPAHGQLALNPNGTFTYTPDANYSGPDSFTYKANDGALDSNVATVNLTVTAVNDPPVGVNDTATTAEDTAVSIDVLANDTDVENDPLFAAGLTQPQFGTVAVQNGRILYTPPTNWSGMMMFTYRPSDRVGTVNGSVATVSVTVTPVNDAPVAVGNSYTSDQDVPLTVAAPGVLGNDTDADGDTLTAAVATGPTNGSVVVNADGSFTYTPTPNWFGTDSFTYTAADPAGLTATATVTLTVLRTNDPPVAVDDSATTNEDTQVGIAVITNDSDPNNDPILAVVFTQPANGTATYSPNDGKVYYNPRANWFGTDTFTYRAYDGRAYSEPATVTVTVNPVADAPVALNNTYSVAEDTTLVVGQSPFGGPPGVLANDTDADGDPLTAVFVSGPTNGTLTLNADGSFTYTPHPNVSGTDQFYYRASDGQLQSGAALVTINVIAVNDPPVGNPDTLSATEDVTLNILQSVLLGNDTDPDGTVVAIGDFTQPTSGGSLIRSASFAGLIYRPLGNFNGTDTFTYRPRDNGQLQGNEVTVTINVAAVNDAPFGVANSYTVAEDTTLTVPAAGVLANDSDAEGDPFTVTAFTQPANGTLQANPDGSFVYTPRANFTGTDTFTYRPKEDGANGLSGNTTTVTITVTAVNDAPVANPDSYTVAEDGALTVTPAPTFDQQSLLGGQHWSAGLSNVHLQQSVVAGQAGTLASFDLFVGFDSTPGASFDVFVHKGAPWQTDAPEFLTRLTVTQAMLNQWVTFDVTAANVVLAAGETFTIGTKNGSGNATVVASYSANGESYAPGRLWYNSLPASSGNFNQDLKFRTRMVAPVGVLPNDTDIDGNPLTAVLVDGPAHGTLSLAANGGFTYTPHANYFGPDSFTYKANDGALDSNVATVTIDVTAVNDAPSMTDIGSVTIGEDAGQQTVNLTGIGAGPNESQTLTVTATSSNTALIPTPAVSYSSPDTTGSLSFTPVANASGTATITVTVSDGSLTAVRQFTVTVTAVNDAPVAVDDTQFTVEDSPVEILVLNNDSDVDGGTLTVSAATNGANGTVTVGTYKVTYTPAANFFGSDTFTYTVSDGNGGFATATVSVTVGAVNDAPTAVDDTATTAEDTPVTIAVLDNDTDIENDTLEVTYVTPPVYGTMTFTATGVLYTPRADWSGVDLFTYTVHDGNGGYDYGTVYVSVTAVNDAPTLGAINNRSILEDAAQQTVNLTGIGAGPNESQALTVTATSSNPALIPNPTVSYTSPAATGSLSFTPAANASGSATVTVTVSDGQLSVSRTFTVTVTAVNDAPVAVGDSATTAEDTPVAVAVLDNDTDIDGGTPTVTAVTNGTNGTVTFTATGVTYTPRANWNGTDSFTYTVSDGNGGTATAAVSVTVTPVNDAPTTTGLPAAALLEDAAPTDIALTGGFADVEDGAAGLTYAVVANTNPTLFSAVSVTGGVLRLTPAANASGSATLTVRATDAGGLSVQTTLAVTVTAVNDAPTFSPGANQSVAAGSGPRSVAGWATGISRGPADEGNQGLTFLVTTTNPDLFVSLPAIDPATGALTFIPEASATGTATVTVVLRDTGGTANGGADTSVTRTFTITVTSNGLSTTPGARVVNGELLVIGGEGTDTVTVSPASGNKVKVQGTLNGASINKTFNGVSRVRVDVKGGNDTVTFASNLTKPTWTDAGAGNDTVTGGGGDDEIYLGAGDDTATGGAGNDFVAGGAGKDLIDGGAGNDTLYGGDDNDFVIGGPGVDDLFGQGGSDILVGGSAAVRSGSDSLRKVLTDWNPASTGLGGYANLRTRLNVTDDGVTDELRGDAGTDWFWGVALEPLDQEPGELRN